MMKCCHMSMAQTKTHKLIKTPCIHFHHSDNDNFSLFPYVDKHLIILDYDLENVMTNMFH